VRTRTCHKTETGTLDQVVSLTRLSEITVRLLRIEAEREQECNVARPAFWSTADIRSWNAMHPNLQRLFLNACLFGPGR
jgi:hypothetical protein